MSKSKKKRRGKVVEGFDIFFKDDFSLIESEISKRMTLPTPYFVDPDQLLIIYNGRIFSLGHEAPASTDEDYMKVYTESYKPIEIGSVQESEQKYFEDFDSQLSNLKKDFIESCVDIPLNIKMSLPELGKQVGKELIKKIKETHPKKPKKAKAATLFSELGYDKALILDKKLYELVTIPQFLEGFDKDAFDPQEPEFYKALVEMSRNATPEEVSQYLERNKPKVHKNAFYIIRDKIWCNEKSGELLIDGTYFIPEYVGHTDGIIDNYLHIIEREVKLDAAKQYQKTGVV